MKPQIRLSQCMIVKNEEKNMRRALSWGKEIAFEQIVVDTGSTDRTVELAKEMGATVYHFEWNDDFSAAKNFAIDQASGNWIAFLDADEYFTQEGAKEIIPLLERIDGSSGNLKKAHIISSSMVNLDDAGKPFSRFSQMRIFRNMEGLRYHNRIHEAIYFESGKKLFIYDAGDRLMIYHTGYSRSAFDSAKAERNIHMLEKELEERPEDYNLMSYLGDTLAAKGDIQKAEKIFQKVVDAPASQMEITRRNSAFFVLLRAITHRNQASEEWRLLNLYHKATDNGNQYPDFDYWTGMWMFQQNEWEDAISFLELGLRKLETYDGGDSVYIATSLGSVYRMLALSYLKLEDKVSTVKYLVLSLRLNKYADDNLRILLSLLKEDQKEESNADETFQFLKKLYDFGSIKDKLILLKCARSSEFYSLESRIYHLFNADEKKWLEEEPEYEYEVTEEELSGKYADIQYNNQTDRHFLMLIKEIETCTDEVLLQNLKNALARMKQNTFLDYEAVLTFYSKMPFWGALVPEADIYDTLTERVSLLKKHTIDILWLYRRLYDYRSKKALTAILDNWLHWDTKSLLGTIEKPPMYFDLDIISCGKDNVFVDLGAYTGDTLENYINTYGKNYRKIYCYEINSEAVEKLKLKCRGLENIFIIRRAAGSGKGSGFIVENREDASYHCIVQGGKEDYGLKEVEISSIDEDISEAVSFIKMDVEGMEQAALKGCEKQIKANHPKLAISLYHGYKDLWEIPKMIEKMDPCYRFYIRHYGGNLIPTEFILYAI